MDVSGIFGFGQCKTDFTKEKVAFKGEMTNCPMRVSPSRGWAWVPKAHGADMPGPKSMSEPGSPMEVTECGDLSRQDAFVARNGDPSGSSKKEGHYSEDTNRSLGSQKLAGTGPRLVALLCGLFPRVTPVTLSAPPPPLDLMQLLAQRLRAPSPRALPLLSWQVRLAGAGSCRAAVSSLVKPGLPGCGCE